MGQKVEVGGTGYDLKGGKPIIGGTAYAIKKGRTLIGGTGYDISLASGLIWEIGHTNPTLSPLTSGVNKFTNIPFYCPTNGSGYTEIDIYYGESTLTIFFNSGGSAAMVYSKKWYINPPVRLEFESAPTGDLLAWLDANGVMVKE